MKNHSQKKQSSDRWRFSLLYSQSGRIFLLGCLGVVGFPSYYWVWDYLFPQPYENLWLRLSGSLLFFPLLFAFHFEEKKWFGIYFYSVITFPFPFFFFFPFLLALLNHCIQKNPENDENMTERANINCLLTQCE